ncbi:hypothetical protein LOTGIDRAFT_176814, partial [Lottia gigantea]
MSDGRRVLFHILILLISKSWSFTINSFWKKFPYTGPVTFNYYSLIPSCSLIYCTATCSSLYNWDQIYYQGEDCYCLAPSYVYGTGMITTNSSMWTIFKEESYCTEKEYKIFPDQKYCLKHFLTGQTWEDDNIRCRQDSGYLISVYTLQDLTNLRSLYT